MLEPTQTGELPAAPWMDQAVDPLPWINERLKTKETFIYLRFNDGEAYSMYGLKRAPETNGEHVYSDALRRSLLRTFTDVCCASVERDDVLVGSWWMEDLEHPASLHMQEHLHLMGLLDEVRWARGCLWHREERPCPNEALLEMVGLIKSRSVCLVGNASLTPVAQATGWKLLEVPGKNAEGCQPHLVPPCLGRNLVYLWCAGFPAKRWAWELWEDSFGGTCHIDCGALFDGLVGNESRSWLKRGSGPHADFYHGEFRKAVGL